MFSPGGMCRCAIAGSVPLALRTEWVTLRKADAKVFKEYSQMKREALATLNTKPPPNEFWHRGPHNSSRQNSNL